MTPKLAGPNATSSARVGMNNWSSGSWNTTPTRRRISRMFLSSTGSPDTATEPAPEAAQPKLNKALRVAEREQKEGEFDECLDAVGDAKRALPK